MKSNKCVLSFGVHANLLYLHVVITDGPLFPPDHELSLRMEGVEKPRKKRGRPPKPSSEEQKSPVETVEQNKKEQEEEEDELDAEGRRKRRIKVPARFLEAVQVIKIKINIRNLHFKNAFIRVKS